MRMILSGDFGTQAEREDIERLLDALEEEFDDVRPRFADGSVKVWVE